MVADRIESPLGTIRIHVLEERDGIDIGPVIGLGASPPVITSPSGSTALIVAYDADQGPPRKRPDWVQVAKTALFGSFQISKSRTPSGV